VIAGDPVYDQFAKSMAVATGKPASEVTVPADAPPNSLIALMGRAFRDRDEAAWEQLRPVAVLLLERQRLH
jgi:hypothetical protein